MFGVIAALTALLLELSMPWKRQLRWMATLAGPMLAFACYRIAPFLQNANLEGAHLCRDLVAARQSTGETLAWHRYWAPFQLAVLGALLVQAL